MRVEIRPICDGDQALLAGAGASAFDDPIVSESLDAFLRDPHHHLIGAIKDKRLIGFVSAVCYAHPDKPAPEFWINEVGVIESAQGKGIGKALIGAALRHARILGCSEAWVLTEEENAPAKALYASAGGRKSEAVMFTFALDERAKTD